MGLLDRILGRPPQPPSCFELGYCQGQQYGDVTFLDFRAKRRCDHIPPSEMVNIWVRVPSESILKIVPVRRPQELLYLHIDLAGVHWDFRRPVRMAYGITCGEPCVALGGEMDVFFTLSDDYRFRDFGELLREHGTDDDLEQMKAMGVERRSITDHWYGR